MIFNFKNWNIKFWNDYQFRKVNWINYTLIAIDFERDYPTNTYEIEIGLLGLHIKWIYFVGNKSE